MTGAQTIKCADLLRMLGSDGSADRDQSIVEILSDLDVDELTMRAIPASELRTTYERRRARMPDSHPSAPPVDRLLAALAAYRRSDVNAVVVDTPVGIAAVWLSEPVDVVLATLLDRGDR